MIGSLIGSAISSAVQFSSRVLPPLKLNLLSGASLSPIMQFNRASTAMVISSAGELMTVPANTPRWQRNPNSVANGPVGLLVEEQRTNVIRNPRGEGGVPGSTLPTFWQSFNIPNGMSLTLAGNGVEDGFPYTDIHISGSPASSNATAPTSGWSPDVTNTTPVVAGEPWTASIYARLVSGSLDGLYFVIMAQERAGSLPDDRARFEPSALPLAQQRTQVTRIIGTTGTAWAPVRFAGYSAGVTYDVTIRVAGHQFERGGFASSLMLPPAGSPGVTTRAEDQLGASQAALVAAGVNMSRGTIGIRWQELSPAVVTSNRLLFHFSDFTNNNRIQAFINSGSATVSGRFAIDGVAHDLQANSNSLITTGDRNSYAMTWAGGVRYAHSVNGGTVTSIPLTASPSLSKYTDGLRVMRVGIGTTGNNAIIESIVFHNGVSMTDAMLVAEAGL